MAYAGNQALPGMRPVRNAAGTAPQVREYPVLSTYAVTIGEGSLVAKTATGLINVNSTVVALTYPTIVGVAAHNLKATPGAGATILVYDDPEQVFEVTADTAVGATTQISMIGQYSTVYGALSTTPAAVTDANAYDGTLGQSGICMHATGDLTSLIAAGDLLKVVRWSTNTGETALDDNAQVLVKITPRFHIHASHLTTHIVL